MAHLYTAYRCNFCDQIPECAPLYHCPSRHRYCSDCFRKLQRSYRGGLHGGSCCVICQYSGNFEKSDVSSDFLRKLKVRPGIGRPYRYGTRKPDDELKPCNITASTENLFRSKSRGDGFMSGSTSLSTINVSKRPLTCFHDGCKKSVAVSSLVSHFKHEHGSVPRFNVERLKELNLLFDVSLVEHDRTFCMAMVTVYGLDRIDVGKSRSSQNVIDTCTRLSGKVPVNTFWLMVSGSVDQRKATSYVVYWLYSNTDDRYWCTMELSSENNKISVSSFCNAVGLHESCAVEDVAESLNCLFVSHGTFTALLMEGDEVNFRIMIH